MTKDQQISFVEEAVKSHFEHLFDTLRLSLLGSMDSDKIATARLKFHEGLDELAFARDQAIEVVNSRGDL